MRTTLIRSSLAALLALTTWGVTALGSSSPLPSDPGTGVDPVYVDSVEIVYLESYPVQAHLLVRGSLPTPCHDPVFEVQDLGDVIDVRIWSLAPADQICAQVLEPFELSIPLGSFESADLPVRLNDEEVGRLRIGAGPSAEGEALVGAGWSFGMCAGYCIADLEIDGERLVLTGRGHMVEEPFYVNEGVLTPEARKRLEASVAALDGLALEAVYGCPDCADGGGAYLTLLRDGEITQHTMEFGNPPQELAELYELSSAIISALETCHSDALVEVSDACQPASAPVS